MLPNFFIRLPLIALLLLGTAGAQDDPALAQRDLELLRERLQGLEQQLDAQLKERDSALTELRDAERAEAAARARLDTTREELAASRKRLAALQKELASGRAELATELQVLGSQLRAAYVTGQQEWLRLVLSAEDPLDTGRQVVHYGYLSRARGEMVEAVRVRVASLTKKAAAVADEERRLAKLEDTQSERMQALQARRDERATVVAGLERNIDGRTGEIGELEAEAAALETLVNELTLAIAELAVGDSTPFAGRKGGMNWPADGRQLHRFGQARADGRLRWDGTLLAAPAGSEVRAIHHGRVVFADWLPGLGLLAVLEHGDGYLSLYGHNRDLVKDVGDWVATGDVLAHVGDSGGRAEAGLYFEIRKNGRPVDPRPWMR